MIQWNARGLTKSKLIEFKYNLRLLSPDVVILSETHWKPNSIPTFKAYNLISKNREDDYGGVAILI